jgi:Spy/CpxP family protein refolding chaperone
MLGFILGAACVIGVGRMLRRRAWHGRFGYGGHDGGCQGHGGYGMRFRGVGPFRSGRWALRALFERLETTPGQERAILSALDELRENRKVVRDELKQTKGDLARAIEGGLIDDASLEESFARHDRLLAQLRVGFVEALKKMTEALDEPQRKQLAQWLEGGFFRRGWGGPDGVWA